MQLDLFPIGWDLILEYIIGVASIGSALGSGIDALTGRILINRIFMFKQSMRKAKCYKKKSKSNDFRFKKEIKIMLTFLLILEKLGPMSP